MSAYDSLKDKEGEDEKEEIRKQQQEQVETRLKPGEKYCM